MNVSLADYFLKVLFSVTGFVFSHILVVGIIQFLKISEMKVPLPFWLYPNELFHFLDPQTFLDSLLLSFVFKNK